MIIRRYLTILILLLPCLLLGRADIKKHWCFFKDKGYVSKSDADKAFEMLEIKNTERANRRRELRGRGKGLYKFSDLPVNRMYIEALESRGVEVVNISRWYNAASVIAADDILKELEKLPFVESIDEVLKFKRRIPEVEMKSCMSDSNELYGYSFAQVDQIGVTTLHRLGFAGSDVLICFMDSGFRTSHEVFDSTNIVAEYDFINSDSITSQEPGESSDQTNHGTSTLSVTGGFKDGVLRGTAFQASYLLAKTEVTSVEEPIEEDYWISALEWADSLGADIINSSLGYSDWYEYSDLDGNTSRLTQALDYAASIGILVHTAAGNSGPLPRSILVPADADSALTCGAVSERGILTLFSSKGPTYDGRIKPDICAMGSGVRCADDANDHAYDYASGTSLSTPLLAGGSAILMQIHSDWDVGDFIEAIKRSSNNFTSPDNDYGWGIPDFSAAVSVPLKGRTTILLAAAWNLISIPLSDTIHYRDTLFPCSLPYVFHFDPVSYNWEMVYTLYPGESYFVYSFKDTLVDFRGRPSSDSVELALAPGWNLIGGPGFFYPVDEIVHEADGAISKYDFYSYDPFDNKYVRSREGIYPGRGYWLFSDEYCSVKIKLEE